MSAAVVAIGIASIFLAAFATHLRARWKREAEDEPPIPEFQPQTQLRRRIKSSEINWEI